MNRVAVWLLAGCIPTLASANEPISATALTATQVVEKNIAARGGLEAWRKIQAMTWIGHIESSRGPAPNMPFVLEMKRPNKTRFEIKAQSQTSVRIYDGTHGWKLRPTSSGKPELKPYTVEELNFARDGAGIDGLLMDYQAKGVTVMLEGMDEIEGSQAYRLNVTLDSGNTHHVWIDSQNFLEIKYDRESRNSFGQVSTVSQYYRNYQTIEGLRIPLTIESGVGTTKATGKLVIDKVLLNPPLGDDIFARPNIPWQRNRVSNQAASSQFATSGWTGLNPGSLPASKDVR